MLLLVISGGMSTGVSGVLSADICGVLLLGVMSSDVSIVLCSDFSGVYLADSNDSTYHQSPPTMPRR